MHFLLTSSTATTTSMPSSTIAHTGINLRDRRITSFVSAPLIMPCRHFCSVHITYSLLPLYVFNPTTDRRATCRHAIYVVSITMPFHPFDCCCHNDFDAACTHSITSASNQTINTRAVSIRPPKSTRTQCTQRSIKASPSRIHSTTWHHRPHTVPLSTCRIP
jgi:hypothetical protein